MNKRISIFWGCAIALALLPAIGVTAAAAPTPTRTTPIDLTALTEDVEDTGEGWSWDAQTLTMTLNGLDLKITRAAGSGVGQKGNADNYAINCPADATIVVTSGSTNTITDNSTDNVAAGIRNNGNLTIRNSDESATDATRDDTALIVTMGNGAQGIGVGIYENRDGSGISDETITVKDIALTVNCRRGIQLSASETQTEAWDSSVLLDHASVTQNSKGDRILQAYTNNGSAKITVCNDSVVNGCTWLLKSTKDATLTISDSTVTIGNGYFYTYSPDNATMNISGSSVHITQSSSNNACIYVGLTSAHTKAVTVNIENSEVDLNITYKGSGNKGPLQLMADAGANASITCAIKDSTVNCSNTMPGGTNSGIGLSCGGTNTLTVDHSTVNISAYTGIQLQKGDNIPGGNYKLDVINGSTVNTIGIGTVHQPQYGYGSGIIMLAGNNGSAAINIDGTSSVTATSSATLDYKAGGASITPVAAHGIYIFAKTTEINVDGSLTVGSANSAKSGIAITGPDTADIVLADTNAIAPADTASNTNVLTMGAANRNTITIKNSDDTTKAKLTLNGSTGNVNKNVFTENPGGGMTIADGGVTAVTVGQAEKEMDITPAAGALTLDDSKISLPADSHYTDKDSVTYVLVAAVGESAPYIGEYSAFSGVCTPQGSTTTHTHTPAGAVRENEVAATAAENGHYERVVYCKDCGLQLSRRLVTVLYDNPSHSHSSSKTVKPTVTSAPTGDSGVILYAAMGTMSIFGSALAVRRRKEG